MRSLNAIGMETKTDKITNHRYDPFYERHLAHLRDKPIVLLEIGIEFGKSLQMWREYFPKARIIGIDKKPYAMKFVPKGAEGFVGDQADPAFLKSITDKAGGFDVVIDDGGHHMAPQQASFKMLFPHVRPNGYYVMEDVATSYQPRFGGGKAGTPGRTIDMMKDLVDQMDHSYDLRFGPRAHFKIRGVCFYEGIVFIERNETP
jgi:cephalosporin hydroxylase